MNTLACTRLVFSRQRKTGLYLKELKCLGQSSVYQRRLDHFNMKMDMKEDISLTTIDEFCLQEDHPLFIF
ncbi:MAG: hypothetical protein U0T56_02960 [Ferruginibacter sp.]